MKQVKCIFCGQIREKAKEHIWPRWLQIKIGGSTKGHSKGIHLKYLIPINLRDQSGESLVYGQICKTCNNGWMKNELELYVHPIINKLLSDVNFIQKLTGKEYGILSKWAFKTALMINAGSNYRKIIPASHFKHLYIKKTVPENTVIDFCQLTYEKSLNWLQSEMQFKIVKKKDIGRFKGTYIITEQIGNLGIRVAYCPNADENNYIFESHAKESHTRIFPFKNNHLWNSNKLYNDLISCHLDIGIVPM